MSEQTGVLDHVNGLQCSRCGSDKLKNVPLAKFGLNYLSGIIVKTKPVYGTVCLVCGKVELQVQKPEEIIDKQLVQGNSANFLPFVLFALFILSLQLD